MAFFGEHLDHLFQPDDANDTAVSGIVIDHRDGVLTIELLENIEE